MIEDLLPYIQTCEETLRTAPDNEGLMRALAELHRVAGKRFYESYRKTRSDEEFFGAMRHWERAIWYDPNKIDESYLDQLYEAIERLDRKGEVGEIHQYFDLALWAQNRSDPTILENLLVVRRPILEKYGRVHAYDETLRNAHFTSQVRAFECAMGEQKVSVLRDVAQGFEKLLARISDRKDHDYIETLYRQTLVLHLLSRQEEAIAHADEAVKLQEETIAQHPLGKKGIRFIPHRSCLLQNIGQMCNEIEGFAKMKELGWIPPYRGVLLAPREKVVNPAMLNYWRKHVCAVTDPVLCERLGVLHRDLEYNTFWVKLPNGRRVYSWSGMISIQNRWEAQSRPPVLHLSQRHREKGWAWLHKLGVPKDRWIVPLHVRDQTFGKDGVVVHVGPTANRDADVMTYIPAIKEIVRRGGWVVRLGSASMKPFPEMYGVLDYAHSEAKCDWMDLFCVAEGRFYFGTASGMNGLPISFDVPAVLTNLSPMNIFSVCKRDLFLPKLMKFKQNGKLLNFRECLNHPYLHALNNDVYQVSGVDVIDNTPEEIREVIVEMMDRLDGVCEVTEWDEALQKSFQDLAEPYEPYGITARIGRDFLRSYQHLLQSSAPKPTRPKDQLISPAQELLI